MVKCKYAGDIEDEYCKDCDGFYMVVDDKKIKCEECAGYEPNPGDEEEIENVSEKTEETTQAMNPPEDKVKNEDTSETTQKREIKAKTTKVTNNKCKTKKAENEANNNAEQVVKVKEEKKAEEQTEICSEGIKIVSMRYTSGATIKKGDNYFKFVAEEEWDTSNVIIDIQDVREQLWAKLNAEVDSQIEELNNMN